MMLKKKKNLYFFKAIIFKFTIVIKDYQFIFNIEIFMYKYMMGIETKLKTKL